MPLTPKNRKEEWLEGLVEHSTTLTPKNRPEEWMLGLIEGSTTLTSKNRCEAWMKEIIDAQGGGSSDLQLIYEDEMSISTSSTSVTIEGAFTIPELADITNENKILMVCIFDKAGPRNNYYYGSLSYVLKSTSFTGTSFYTKSDGTFGTIGTSYGIFPSLISATDLRISSRFNSSFGTLDGTFSIKVYTLDIPTGA